MHNIEYPGAGNLADDETLTLKKENLESSIEKAHRILYLNSDDSYDSDSMEDTGSDASRETDDDTGETNHFHLCLLMNLVPSIERAYSQLGAESQNQRSVFLVNEQSLGVSDTSYSEALPKEIPALGYSTQKGIRALRSEPHIDYGEEWAISLRKRYEKMLRVRKLDQLRVMKYSSSLPPGLQKPSHANESSTEPPSYSKMALSSFPLVRKLPKLPTPPVDTSSLRFRNLLQTLSLTPTRYENPTSLDEALSCVPLDRIYNEAEEETLIFQAKAKSLGSEEKEEWGYQDCVTRALLRCVSLTCFYSLRNRRARD